MQLPLHVSEKMKAILGTEGMPHRILVGQWVETGFWEWKRPLPTFDLETPEPGKALEEVFKEITHKIGEENFDTKAGYLDIKKYQARMMEVFEQVKTPQLQAEFDLYQPKAITFFKQHAQWLKTHKIGLKKIRDLLKDEAVIVYWAELEWEGNIPETLVVAPITDQFEVLQIEQTSGSNYGVSTNDLIVKLKALDEKYGIEITGANTGGVDFILKRIPKGKEAIELGIWLLQICPDLYEAPRRFPKGKVSLGWD